MGNDNLIDLLDPNRSYGDRSYDDVVDAVEARKLRLEPGHNLPVIKDASTNLVVVGTGRPRQEVDARVWGRKLFEERAAGDFDEVYAAMVESAKSGDVRAQKLFMEMYIGRPREASPNSGGADLLLEMMQRHYSQSYETTLAVEDDRLP